LDLEGDVRHSRKGVQVLRRVLAAAAVTTVATLVIPAGPVHAVERRDPLEGLAVHPEWGSLKGHGGVLRRGCHRYTYSYSITPPEGIWALEIFISGPNLEALGGGALAEGYDPETGTGTYKLCRNTTRRGRFAIDAKLSVDDGYGTITDGRLPTDHFRLRRAHRR
jgi:hypothetical protein